MHNPVGKIPPPPMVPGAPVPPGGLPNGAAPTVGAPRPPGMPSFSMPPPPGSVPPPMPGGPMLAPPRPMMGGVAPLPSVPGGPGAGVPHPPAFPGGPGAGPIKPPFPAGSLTVPPPSSSPHLASTPVGISSGPRPTMAPFSGSGPPPPGSGFAPLASAGNSGPLPSTAPAFAPRSSNLGMPAPPGSMPVPPGPVPVPPTSFVNLAAGPPPPRPPGMAMPGHGLMPPPPPGGLMPLSPPGGLPSGAASQLPVPGATGVPPTSMSMGPPPPGAPAFTPAPPPIPSMGVPPPPGSGVPPPPMGGLMPSPPPMPEVGMGPPPPPGLGLNPAPGFSPYDAQPLAERVEALSMGAGIGPGAGAQGVDLAALPRPIGDQKAAALTVQPSNPSNCSVDNMRLTVQALPSTTALRARWPLPMGVIVHPMSDDAKGDQVPVVDLGASGIVRCRRCRTYMNPYMTWEDSGRRYKCNVCQVLNEVPMDYFSHLDHTGVRSDLHLRPELSTGTVEYIAPADYMVRAPQPPTFVFVIDVSHASVTNGMLATVCATIKDCLDALPGEERTLFGVLTFDSTLHYYNLKASLTTPQMLVVAEVDEPFVPLPDDLLVNLRESRSVIDTLLESLPTTLAKNTCVESATGPALQAAFMIMQHIGGKMLLFQTSPPSIGPGKIKPRENFALYGTDREASLRQPDDPFFKRFAAECSRAQITMDIFAFNMQPMDLASLAAIPRYTCGDLNHYAGFTAARDGAKLRAELSHNLTRATAWEAVMRVRCSQGLRTSSFHGHFFNRSTDLMALPTCNPDKAFGMQISHEENVVQRSLAFVQCALLYTNSNGERRIRVHTLSVPLTSELSDMYKTADHMATSCLLAKMAVERSLTNKLEDARTMLQTKLISTLKEFRLISPAARAAANRLVLPESLRLLPLWMLGLMKSPALKGGAKDVNPDERIVVGHDIVASSPASLAKLLYPDLYPLHDIGGSWGTPNADGMIQLPSTLPLTGACLDERGAFLLDNGRVMLLWLGRMLDKAWAMEVFGVDLQASNVEDALELEPARPESALSMRINAVLAALRLPGQYHQQCFVVRQGSRLELLFAQHFIEDRGPGMHSYSDWMMLIHKAVLTK